MYSSTLPTALDLAVQAGPPVGVPVTGAIPDLREHDSPEALQRFTTRNILRDITIAIEHLCQTPDTTNSPISWLGSFTDLVQTVPASQAHCNRLCFLAWIHDALKLPFLPELTSKVGRQRLPTPLTTISSASLRIAVLPHASSVQQHTGADAHGDLFSGDVPDHGVFSGTEATCTPEPGLQLAMGTPEGDRSRQRLTPAPATCPPGYTPRTHRWALLAAPTGGCNRCILPPNKV
jgi:hypothetical protein